MRTLELQLEEMETAAGENASQGEADDGDTTVRAFTRRKPKRAPLPADLPRERVVLPSPEACPCCGGADLVKLGEDVTETLEVVPRQWKVVQTVREKFSCRACEAITQPPAPHLYGPFPDGKDFFGLVPVAVMYTSFAGPWRFAACPGS